MSVLIFPKLNWNHIFFLLLFISYFAKLYVNKISNQVINKKNGNEKEPEYNCRLFFNIYIYTISDLFSILLFIISKIKSRHRQKKKELIINNEKKENNLDNSYENDSKIDFNSRNTSLRTRNNYFYKGELPINEFKLFIHIFLVSITDLLATYVKFLFFLLNKNAGNPYLQYLLIFNMFFKYIFSRIFLKNKFYRHHYLSFVINIIGLIFLDLIQIEDSKNVKKDSTYFKFVFVLIFNTGCYSFGNVIGKRALVQEYLSPYSLLMLKGILELILLLIFSVPFFFLKTTDDHELIFKGFAFYINTPIKAFNTLLLMISNFLYNVFIWIITDKFTPSHLTMTNILEEIAYDIFSIIYEFKITWEIDLLYKSIIYLVLIIGAMIHNEVVVINICGLNKKTKYHFDINALLDMEQTKEIKEEEDLEMILKVDTLDDEYYMS